MNRPKHLSLIKIRLLIDSNVCSAIVDSGCNVSCISDSLVKDLNLILFPLNEIVNSKTANNVIQCLGRVKCNVTIGFKTSTVQLYVINSLNHSFILGLDLISIFNLEISPGLQVFQHINVNGLEHKEEIL